MPQSATHHQPLSTFKVQPCLHSTEEWSYSSLQVHLTHTHPIPPPRPRMLSHVSELCALGLEYSPPTILHPAKPAEIFHSLPAGSASLSHRTDHFRVSGPSCPLFHFSAFLYWYICLPWLHLGIMSVFNPQHSTRHTGLRGNMSAERAEEKFKAWGSVESGFLTDS